MDHTDTEEAILAQARRDFDGWSSGEPLEYAQSAADDVTYFHNAPAGARVDGIQAFRGYLAALKGRIPPHDYEIVDPKVQVYGDVGIFTLAYHALSSEGELLARARGTCVYRKADGSWLLVHAHWSAFEET